ncbi:hypothetical protein EIN_346690 [Entamoeba invadens IP1]|uniref:Uncharacterized protein n=1 Tax=Entamoeba invadens IP1 TaxID=370355 RepID=L7FJD4_ENTIV|nr:hypothetical protein EIN_346690 [Entamoeba invadens IP1]ELP84022.1 hypothetical protein EIN_346690 [Entamoeba invadens IP1]|eukprot:XP_004183368.1 hypothetical protein EIN_346690 [Entamoeba invadens IP1]
MENKLPHDEMIKLAAEFNDEMVQLNRAQREKFNVPIRHPKEDQAPQITTEDVRRKQIENDLGITSGSFKFKKTKTKHEDIIPDKPESKRPKEDANEIVDIKKPLEMKKVEDTSLSDKLAAFELSLKDFDMD